MKILLIILNTLMQCYSIGAAAYTNNLEKALQISFADLHNLQPLNCTPTIPSKVVALMSAYSAGVASNNSAFDRTIPAEYLMSCLLNADYDKRIAAFYYQQSPSLNFNFALNEVISLTFDGTLTCSVTFGLKWTEPRLTWNANSDLQHWNWPPKVDINPLKLWLPVYFIHNCPNTSCAIPIDSNAEIDISNDGTIDYVIMRTIQATCSLVLSFYSSFRVFAI